MNRDKINILKQVSEKAVAAHVAEKTRLTVAGFKSQERYTMLKDFKAAADAAYAEYSKFTKAQIARELDKIVADERPDREAAARSRSPWKQAKFDAANK